MWLSEKCLYFCALNTKKIPMPQLRFRAVEEAFGRLPLNFTLPTSKVSEYFGVNVFDREKMRRYLSSEAFESVVNSIDEGRRIDRKIAGQVAAGMKSWAMELGATHYTHWFHPLNGATAEKHDSFFTLGKESFAFENFSGDLLVQQEPDASSFPSGGIRNTFEARGYTAWDPSSPAFVLEQTLCIPTIFVSYTGEALDFKTPHLKSLAALDRAATEVCNYFDKDVKKVFSTLGWEQEYFLVDESLYNARPDLVLTGRTLMGHAAAKDQQLEDHYFGSIPERVSAFMKHFEVECYKLGIPIKTRHNEVAPNQFECAPIFEEANLAVDHNQLLMSLMDKIARKHHFRVLFHEKPFKGINGSGKHCNWSLLTSTGVNLLSPGGTPKNNLQFLTFLVNTLKAVHDHSALLIGSIASEANTHRLGANEAPPAIMSVFIGKTLSAVLDELEEKVHDNKMTPDEKTELKLDIIGKIPEILLDNTDRNRTSPFAFTGNRFEFRAVGSSASCASPMIALNAAMAEQLTQFKVDVDTLIERGIKKDEAILQCIRRAIIDSKRIRFEGNGYSQEWIEEAKMRGLPNIPDATEAFKTFLHPSSKELFRKFSVLSDRELHARYEIRNEIFVKKVQIESRVLADLAINHIIPTVLGYQNILIQNVKGINELFSKEEYEELASPQLQSIRKISEHVRAIREMVKCMVDKRKDINQIQEIHLRAEKYSKDIKVYVEEIRYHIDKLELIVDNQLWPLPKYRELLFIR